jgi:F-type H+-transporting ATPase subunit b
MQLSAYLGALLSGGSIIDLDGTVFVQLAMFFVAFGVLYVLVFKPMVALIEAREQAIDGAKDEAKHLEHDVREKQAAFENELRKVRSSGGEERDRLRTETTSLVTDAKTRLAAEAGVARSELAAKNGDLAREIASKVIGREVQG